MAADLTATPGNPATYRGLRAIVRNPALGKYAGKMLDKGQVFVMHGAGNDDRLIRLGYAELLPKGAETVACPMCGASFSTAKGVGSPLRNRDNHADRRHMVRDIAVERAPQLSDIAKIDQLLESANDEESMARMTSMVRTAPDDDPATDSDSAPLYLDQTAAERGVNPDTPITL